MTRNPVWWVRLLAINAAASVVADVTLHDRRGVPWGDVVVNAWPGFVIATIVSALCFATVTRIGPVAHRIAGARVRWLIMIPVLVAVAIGGTSLALGLLAMAGRVDGWAGFGEEWRSTTKLAVAVTLVFGIYETIATSLRTELAAATVALRTKERDEAEARRLVSEAQLASLESRVNPHFFFNTLNSIAALTREDAAGAERMTTQLASLMRASLDQHSTPLVPLALEERTVRDYLEIEQVRFGERLRYNIRVPGDAANVLIPRMALQTVVENCVKHAAAPRRQGAAISVTATRIDRDVCIDVTDDGDGFESSVLPDGHGLALLRARLQLLLGKRATMAVQSRPGQTTVRITVPVS